eukprot:TRINITY_DN1636_c0_g1_i4.p1 TRINITY_DN1636_c0_g1~~TRINITY_DN1636_c0_g1_i4.p1  ORF type:complete len:446 (-),score=66.16 TRINITY_DN1636_c0_g1_i4:73-1233(-)
MSEMSLVPRKEKKEKSTQKPRRIHVRISFQGWLPLRSEHDKMMKLSHEEMREKAKEVVTNILDCLMKVAYDVLEWRLVFQEVDLSHTISSMRSIWKGRNGEDKKICRELEIVKLNLSFTVTSSRSVASLYLMTNLTELYLDHCSSLKKTSKVFSLLLKNGSVPSLELLSVVGTSDVFSPDWLSQVESKCPKLKVVYFTRIPGTKAVGWNDAIMMQTMRNPVLLTCGHVMEKDVFKSFRFCSYCRHPFHSNASMVDLNPHITRINRGSDMKWTASIVDHDRQYLDTKALYHVLCGEFYNLSTIKAKYDYPGDNISLETREFLASRPCFGCWRSLSPNQLRICFLNMTEDDNESFSGLSKMVDYVAVDEDQAQPIFDPCWDLMLMSDL